MNKLSKTVLFVVFCTLLTSIAQIFFKYASNKLILSSIKLFVISAVTNLNLYIGVVIYFLAAAILLVALKNSDLSVAYPIIATSYIWVALLSMYFFNEVLLIKQWFGIVFILIGVSFTGYGGKKWAY